jgi:hypothetical protein
MSISRRIIDLVLWLNVSTLVAACGVVQTMAHDTVGAGELQPSRPRMPASSGSGVTSRSRTTE